MESPEARPEIEWFDTPLPRASLWVDSAITIAVTVIYAIILIVTGFSRGDMVLPSAFTAFFGIVLALVWYGPLRLRLHPLLRKTATPLIRTFAFPPRHRTWIVGTSLTRTFGFSLPTRITMMPTGTRISAIGMQRTTTSSTPGGPEAHGALTGWTLTLIWVNITPSLSMPTGIRISATRTPSGNHGDCRYKR